MSKKREREKKKQVFKKASTSETLFEGRYYIHNLLE